MSLVQSRPVHRTLEFVSRPRPVGSFRNAWICLALAAWCLALFFYGLNRGALYRTETLRAVVAAEMLREGRWLVPTLYGEPFLTKPPGMYVAIALASLPAGAVHEWTARLPSALAASGMVFLFYGYFARQLGRHAGLVAAAILPVAFVWLDKAPSAEIDMLQAAWVTAAVIAFLRALETAEDSEPSCRQWLWWSVAMAAVAAGVLTKWTAPVFFYGTAVPLLWWRGRLRLLFRRHHLVTAALGAGVCIAWAGAAFWQVGGETVRETLHQEIVLRLGPSHHRAAYPWKAALAHPFLVLAAALPTSGFALLSLSRGFARVWDERGRRVLQAMHCWVWPSLLFWSVFPGHAVRHSLPLCPGLAGLAAMVWLGWLKNEPQRHRAHREKKHREKGTRRAGDWPSILFLLFFPLRLFFLCVLRASVVRSFPARRGLMALLSLWLVAKFGFVLIVVPARETGRDIRATGARVATAVPPGQILYLFHLKDEGVLFYYGRPARRLRSPAQLPSSSEPVYGILDATEWRQWTGVPGVEPLLQLRDGQGQPIGLVRLPGRLGSDGRLAAEGGS